MWLIAVRTLLAAGLVTALGAPTFRATVLVAVAKNIAEPAAALLARRLVILTRAGAALALAALVASLCLHANSLANPATPIARALPLLLLHTQFGHISLGQGALLLLLLLGASRLAPSLATCLAALALAALAIDGHMAAQYGLVSAGALVAVLHVLAAGSWLGSLIPFLILVATAPTATAAAVTAYFRFGCLYVAGLIVSACIQAVCLLGSFAALWHTRYGGLVLMKLAALALLLGFAFRHQFLLKPDALRSAPARTPTRPPTTVCLMGGRVGVRAGAASMRKRHGANPQLGGPEAPRAIARFQRSLTLQTLVAVLVIAVAMLLSAMPPPSSMPP